MARCTCAACKEQFSTLHNFDLHRVGSHEKRTRRCMTRLEMTLAGLRQVDNQLWKAESFVNAAKIFRPGTQPLEETA